MGQPDFGAVARAIRNAADGKDRRGLNVPLRADVAAELSSWLARRLETLQARARGSGEPIRVHLPASEPLFHVPTGLTRILDRDLPVAAIPKRDERDRVVDVHALPDLAPADDAGAIHALKRPG